MSFSKKIVVFGPDNSGKTTLVNDLESLMKDISIPLEKVPPLGPASMMKQSVYTEDYLSKPHGVIFDRFPCIEEKTCGVILRNSDNFANYPEIYESYIKSVDLFIFCNPGLEAILNWGEREQMEGIKENIFPLYFKYCEIFKDLKERGLAVAEYNWKVPGDRTKIIERIKK